MLDGLEERASGEAAPPDWDEEEDGARNRSNAPPLIRKMAGCFLSCTPSLSPVQLLLELAALLHGCNGTLLYDCNG